MAAIKFSGFTILLGVFLANVANREVFGHKIISVASYNIWNVMFQWDTRKQYIAEMVRF